MRQWLELGRWLGLQGGGRARVLGAGLALLAGAFLLLGLSSPAASLTLDPNPVLFDDKGVSGSITLVETATGIPFGGEVLTGTVSGTDVSLVYEVSLNAGSGALDQIGAGVFMVFSKGAGRIAGTGDVGIASESGDSSIPVFNFDGNLGANQTSDRFFVSYASLSEGSFATFMISPADGSGEFTVTGQLVAVPEASVLLLLGVAGLGAAQAARRRRRGV
jgi:hypothetical protein